LSLVAGRDWIVVADTRVAGGSGDVVIVVVVVAVVVMVVVVVVVVVVVGTDVVVAVVVVVVFVAVVGVLEVGATGPLVGLGLLELERGGRGRVTKPGSVVACQMALGAVCAGAHELTTALLADSIVLATSAAAIGDSELLHINYARITYLDLGPSQPPVQSVPGFFTGGK
jgi:hypothetical protein